MKHLTFLLFFIPLLSFSQITEERVGNKIILTAPTMTTGTSAVYLGTYAWKIAYMKDGKYREVYFERTYRNIRAARPANTVELNFIPISAECLFMEKNGEFQLPIDTFYYENKMLKTLQKLEALRSHVE